jgi:hypothetical protein
MLSFKTKRLDITGISASYCIKNKIYLLFFSYFHKDEVGLKSQDLLD